MPARLTVITGPMFSGKSKEVLRRLERAEYANQAGAGISILAFKPPVDTLYGPFIATKRVTDEGSVVIDKWPAPFVESPAEILRALEGAESPAVLLALDECQFFGDWMYDTIREILRDRAHHDLEIVASGLDLDAERRPWEPMPQMLAMADNVLKLTAVCFLCGNRKAGLTKRIDSTSRARVQPGASDMYQARCRACHRMP